MNIKGEEMRLVTDVIKKSSRVLEYGSGESTLVLSRLCNEVVSIEHQKIWFDDLSKRIPSNVNLILKEPDCYYVEGLSDGDYGQFKSYIEEPFKYAPFDVVLIDGRSRMECASICQKICKPEAFVFIHDFEREEYKRAKDYLVFVEMRGRMAKFRIGKN